MIGAIERIATGRGVALGDARLWMAAKTTTGLPLHEALVRSDAHSLSTTLGDFYSDVEPIDCAALDPADLIVLQAAAAHLNLDDSQAAAGFVVGTRLALLTHSVLQSIAAGTSDLETKVETARAAYFQRLQRRYKTITTRKAQRRSAEVRGGSSDTALIEVEKLWEANKVNLTKRTVYQQVAKRLGISVTALAGRLKRARDRRRQRERNHK